MGLWLAQLPLASSSAPIPSGITEGLNCVGHQCLWQEHPKALLHTELTVAFGSPFVFLSSRPTDQRAPLWNALFKCWTGTNSVGKPPSQRMVWKNHLPLHPKAIMDLSDKQPLSEGWERHPRVELLPRARRNQQTALVKGRLFDAYKPWFKEPIRFTCLVVEKNPESLWPCLACRKSWRETGDHLHVCMHTKQTAGVCFLTATSTFKVRICPGLSHLLLQIHLLW